MESKPDKVTVALTMALRIYLGVLFVWAGVDKFYDKVFLDTTKSGDSYLPGSLAAIIEASKANNPPLKFALDIMDSRIVLAGVVVALAEIVIGLAILVGFKTRWAALGGAAIMGSFVLTVNWFSGGNWYENVNLAAMFAFVGLAALPPTKWSLDTRLAAQSTKATSQDRRDLMGQAVIAGGIAAGAVVLALVGRLFGKDIDETVTATLSPNQPSTSSTISKPSSPPQTISGPVLTTVAEVEAQTAVAVTLPDKKGAWVSKDANGNVVAHSNICTHNGCKVAFAKNSGGLACPCHGAVFDPKTGEALRGPAKKPLASIAVVVDASGNIVSA
jgi:thiosulfate dehydrogenase [quinone] large subunit